MRVALGTVCFACTFLCGMTAWAASIDAIQGETQVTPGQSFQKATVEPVRGELSVNQGQGFQKVNSRIEVKVGDSVMVSPWGAAKITYFDGCKVDVQPGAVTTIAPLSPCASGSNAADLGLPPVYKAAPLAVPPPVDWVPFAVGAAVVGAGIGLCVAFCQQHHHGHSP